MLSPNASQDHVSERVIEILLVLTDSQQQPEQKSHIIGERNFEGIKALDAISTPKSTMELIASHLFISSVATQNSDDAMSIDRALAAMVFLVTTDPVKYLKEASRAVRSQAELQSDAEVKDNVLAVIASQLASDDVEVSTNASGTISALCKTLPPMAARCVNAIQNCWTHVLSSFAGKSQCSTLSVRCASAVVDLAILSENAMEASISCGAMNRVRAMVTDTSDPLQQMSGLDLLEKMANTLPMHRTRAQWLFSRPVLHPLLKMAGGGNGENDVTEPDPLLGGPSLRLLSTFFKLAQRNATLFGLHSDLLIQGFRKALYNFDCGGEVGRLAFIDAVSSFASASTDALSMVLGDPFLRESWLSLASVAQPKLKSVVLNSVARVIDPPVERDANGDQRTPLNVLSNEKAMRLFEVLGISNSRDAVDILLSCAREPIVETRLGAYDLMRAVAKRGRGAHVLLSHRGFYEFLVDRDVEKTKVGKEAKFSIIEAVLGSDVKELLADEIVKSLEAMVRLGPHYVETVPWTMATED